MKTVVFGPRYFGSVDYYAAMARAEKVVIDRGVRYDKRAKDVHRCEIVDTRQRVLLTVPVSKGAEHVSRWQDMAVSAHDSWWERHVTALESAYGRTPFFEFYIDRLLHFMGPEAVGRSIVDVDIELDAVMRRLLLIDAEVTYDASGLDPAETTDYRREAIPDASIGPYWQVRADKLGFTPGSSNSRPPLLPRPRSRPGTFTVNCRLVFLH